MQNYKRQTQGHFILQVYEASKLLLQFMYSHLDIHRLLSLDTVEVASAHSSVDKDSVRPADIVLVATFVATAAQTVRSLELVRNRLEDIVTLAASSDKSEVKAAASAEAGSSVVEKPAVA